MFCKKETLKYRVFEFRDDLSVFIFVSVLIFFVSKFFLKNLRIKCEVEYSEFQRNSKVENSFVILLGEMAKRR
ncbi:hypothetical protein DLM78_04430 [Leptospira stimsonii]|uniref:Uncharacterized protein n=1 Tax=Leptospira stimsonii TaxID=2202203 RepID=A0A8B3CVF6_9LEPT|nr:hypothetical protein DLM78_04430 [Leptospira stimsonii]